jgi:hypothetical protein
LHETVTSQGTAHGRFQRAIERGNLFAADAAARELGGLSLRDALDYIELVARSEPDRYERAALRWHARLEDEGMVSSLLESQFALCCLQNVVSGDRALALSVLRHVVKPRRASWGRAF